MSVSPMLGTTITGRPTFRPLYQRRHPSRPTAVRDDHVPDYYEVLQLDQDAKIDEIKKNFRALQKEHHPDISGNGEVSASLNAAYQTLADPILRSNYDRRLAALPSAQWGLKRSFRDEQGIVGPVSQMDLVRRDIVSRQQTEKNDSQVKSDLTIWLREWAKTFIFASDLPLALPLQCDDVEDGVRLAFITTHYHRISTAGELRFLVEVDEGEQGLSIAVYRSTSSDCPHHLLGEHQVLSSFSRALKDKNESHQEKRRFLCFELSGLAASAAAQFMPVLVHLPIGKNRGASYQAYHLKHST